MDVTVNVGEVYEDDIPAVPRGWTLFIEGSVDTSTAGVYTITYNAREDATGRVVSTSRTVTVVESSSGSISLNGNAVISIDLDDVATYVDAGATSTDGTVLVTNLDGTASESFTGLPNVAGSYTLIYYVSGAFSNFVTRTIHVAEGLNAPSSGPNNVNAEVNPPVEGPANINTVVNPPASGPTDVISGANPPVEGPTSVDVEVNPPASGPTSVDAEIIAPPLTGPTSLGASVILPPVYGPTNIDAVIAPPVEGPTNINLVFNPPVAGPTNVNAAVVEPILPIFCSTTYDPYYGHTAYSDALGISSTQPSVPDRPVPGTIAEVTWTDNPNLGNGTAYWNLHLINEVNWELHFIWWLEKITPTEITYRPTTYFITGVGGPDPNLEAKLIIDPDDPTKNKFISPPRSNVTFNWWTGEETSRMDYVETPYSFNSFHAPCFYDTGSTGTKGFYKYLSNYETGDRITEPFGIGTGDNQINLSTNLPYYRSLVVGGYTSDNDGSAFIDPKGSRRIHGGVMTTQTGVQKYVTFDVDPSTPSSYHCF